jgi:hypothetical protein
VLLPIRTAPQDVETICGYLFTRPEGATAAELLAQRMVDGRKLVALQFWGMIEASGSRLKLSERGRLAVSDAGAHKVTALRDVVAATPPYASVIARAVERSEPLVPSSDVASHWQREFRAYLHFHAGTLNHQIVCFLRVAEGADLGRLVVGRKGKETRFELREDDARRFLREAPKPRPDDGAALAAAAPRDLGGHEPVVIRRSQRVFITRRRHGKVLEQVKELVAFGRFEPVLARERDAGGPLMCSLMEEMRGCDTAVVHVDAAASLDDADRRPGLSGDVLIEIGAAMALYGRNFVLLVEDSVELPPNLQGLCECRYRGDELNMPAMMNLLRAFGSFTRSSPGRWPGAEWGRVVAQSLPEQGAHHFHQ